MTWCGERDVESRFVDLETKVSYLEHHQEELNQVVIEQQKEIDQLKAQVTLLVDHIKSSGQALDPNEPPPPHY